MTSCCLKLFPDEGPSAIPDLKVTIGQKNSSSDDFLPALSKMSPEIERLRVSSSDPEDLVLETALRTFTGSTFPLDVSSGSDSGFEPRSLTLGHLASDEEAFENAGDSLFRETFREEIAMFRDGDIDWRIEVAPVPTEDVTLIRHQILKDHNTSKLLERGRTES
jgi:hypothetical protein